MKSPSASLLVVLFVIGNALTSSAQFKLGIESLPPDDQQIVKGLEFKALGTAPLAERRLTYLAGVIDLVNTGPKNSIAGKLFAQMSMLFVNRDHDWVVVNCPYSKFAVTTKGTETVKYACCENKIFETFFGDRRAQPLTTHTTVKYGDVVIFEEPLNPVAASAPAEWWTMPTGVIGPANDVAVAAQAAIVAAGPSAPKPVSGSSQVPARVPVPLPLQAQTPASAPVNAVVQSQGLVLDHYWESPMQGGKAAMQELAALLSPFAKPAPNTAPSPGLKIFEDVTYLMPYADARKTLNLKQTVVPKAKVGCAGFPKDSFFSYAFDGSFEGQYNKLYIVTDKADQVVAVQLVAGSPKRGDLDAPYSSTDGHTYNFINSKAKAITRLWVDHKPYFEDKNGWQKYDPKYNFRQPKGEVGLLRIDSLLMDPINRDGNRDSNWKALEAVRLYLPKPMMELILHCIRNASR